MFNIIVQQLDTLKLLTYCCDCYLNMCTRMNGMSLQAGQPVCILAEGKQHALALGMTIMSTDKM
jgi:hypothetical protein